MRPDSRHMRAGVITAAVMLFMAVLLAGATAPAHAEAPEDAVLDWNLYAVQALINGPTATPPGVGQPVPVSVLHLAMVQGAVYDAVNMIDGGHEPYLDGLPSAPASASKAAAVATAAHDVLVGMVIVPALTPAIVTRLGGHLDDYLAAATEEDGPSAVAAGIAAGAAAADAMLEERANDETLYAVCLHGGFGGWGLATYATRQHQRPERLGGSGRSVRDDERVAVPDEGADQDR